MVILHFFFLCCYFESDGANEVDETSEASVSGCVSRENTNVPIEAKTEISSIFS
jgi:hypothetical protein